MGSLCVLYKGTTITGLGPCPTKVTTLSKPTAWGRYQRGWGLGVGTPILLLAWEASALLFFESAKKTQKDRAFDAPTRASRSYLTAKTLTEAA